MSEEEMIEKLSNYLKDSLGKDLIKALKITLDKLQKENEELKENSISKDKIKAKIKELEEKDKASSTNIYGYGIKFLKELLEE